MFTILPGSEFEFAGQPIQVVVPGDDLYVPPEHCVHVPPLGPVDPALQTQLVVTVLLAGEKEFTGHTVQGPPVGPVDPALQKHAWMFMLPMSELESVGQP